MHGSASGNGVAQGIRPPLSSLPSRQMLSERLIPFVALDVSASRVQVRCSILPGGWSRAQPLAASTAPCCCLECLLETPPFPGHTPTIQEGKKADLPVYFGDAGSPAVLHAVGADKAACAVSKGQLVLRSLRDLGGWLCVEARAGQPHMCASPGHCILKQRGGRQLPPAHSIFALQVSC